MISFVSSLPLEAFSRKCRCPKKSRLVYSQHAVSPPAERPRATINTLRMAVETDKSRSKVLKHGMDAAVDDFVKSGMNIYVGGGNKEDLSRLLDCLDTVMQAEGLVDMAFVSASTATKSLIQDRDLPTDLRVNFKRGIDLFIAPIRAIDKQCNAVLDSDDIPGDKYAASIANQIVLIIHEEDVEKCWSGLLSVPVKLVQFLPNLAAESLCTEAFCDFGVRGATLRSDNSFTVDLALSPSTLPQALEDELNRLPQVLAVGFLIASKKTTAVIATHDLQPYDMTSALHTMASLDEDTRNRAAQGEQRSRILQMYASDWNLWVRDSDEVLSKEFSFTTAERAAAFVRYVQYVSSQGTHCPEIRHARTRVEVIVTTKDAKGVTELDAMVSKEISSAFNRLQSS